MKKKKVSYYGRITGSSINEIKTQEYTLEEEIDHNQGQQWGEEAIVVESFLHIAQTTIHQTTLKNHPTNRLEID